MTTAIESLLKSYAFNLAYAHRLVEDVADRDMYRSFGSGLENHPAFTLGHLSVASGLVARELGADYDVPPVCDRLFGRTGPGDPNLPPSFEDGMPLKDELLAELERQHAKVEELVRSLSPEELDRPVKWRFKTYFPTLGAFLGFMCVCHESMHLGQVAAWRRAAGLGSALALIG